MKLGLIPQGGEGSLNTKQERKKQKNENEEPVPGNSLGELAPLTKHSTVGERISKFDSEVDAENENEKPVSGNSLRKLAPQNKKCTVGKRTYIWTLKWMHNTKIRSLTPSTGSN